MHTPKYDCFYFNIHFCCCLNSVTYSANVLLYELMRHLLSMTFIMFTYSVSSENVVNRHFDESNWHKKYKRFYGIVPYYCTDYLCYFQICIN